MDFDIPADLQAAIDEWHRAHPGPIADMPAYRSFLEKIGYLPGKQYLWMDRYA